MSARSEIDSLRFAQSAERASGEFAVAELTRLHDILAKLDGVVQWSLEGSARTGRPAIVLRLRGRLTLICQRCLKPCVHALETESILPIARGEDELARWENEDPLLDGLVADPRLNVRDLVEDEILLSLPAIPRHAEGACDQTDGD